MARACSRGDQRVGGRGAKSSVETARKVVRELSASGLPADDALLSRRPLVGISASYAVPAHPSTVRRTRGARHTESSWPHVKVSRSASMPSPKTTRMSDSTRTSNRSCPDNNPATRSAPVVGYGQGSRTNHANPGSAGLGSRIPGACTRASDAHQPVAPVPVPTIKPDDDCRSVAPPTANR